MTSNVHPIEQFAFDSLAWGDYHLRFSRFVPRTHDVILTYHSVGEPNRYGDVSAERLRRDVQFLRDSGYDIVDLPEAVGRDDGDHADGDRPKAALTFDDGYTNFYDHALPVLRELAAPATVFVPAGFVGDENPELLGRLIAPPEEASAVAGSLESQSDSESTVVMTEAQLRELVDDDLVTIGNHTMTHVDLAAIEDPTELEREILGSKVALEERFGIEVDRFSFPYGRFDDRAVELVAASHDVAVTSIPNVVRPGVDIHRVPRLRANVSEPRLRWDLSGLRWRLSDGCATVRA